MDCFAANIVPCCHDCLVTALLCVLGWWYQQRRKMCIIIVIIIIIIIIISRASRSYVERRTWWWWLSSTWHIAMIATVAIVSTTPFLLLVFWSRHCCLCWFDHSPGKWTKLRLPDWDRPEDDNKHTVKRKKEKKKRKKKDAMKHAACIIDDVPVVEIMSLVFTRMPGESYRRPLGSLLLYLCYVFRALINSLCVDSVSLVL